MSNYPKRIYVLPTSRPRGMAVPRVVPSLTPSPSPPQRQLKRVLEPVETEQIVAELLGDDMGPSGPRKRERLNHLSQEEKMDRRKLKNRVAAQNARDKKKERSGKIDEVMRDLVEENARLRAENERLRRQNEELLLQQQQTYIHTPCYTPEHSTTTATDENIYSNVVYEEEVVDEQQDGGDRRAVVVVEEEADQHAFESAVFINAPLPWDKANRSKSDNSNEDSHNVTTIAQLNSKSPSKRTDSNNNNNKKANLNTYLSILSLLCTNQVEPTVIIKKNSNSSESSIISRPHLMESSINSSLTTLKKEATSRRHQLLSEAEDPQCTAPHLQKRVKHFRRHQLAVP